MVKKFYTIIITVILGIFVSGCGQNVPEIGEGQEGVRGGYKNDTYSFSLLFPLKWGGLNEEKVEQIGPMTQLTLRSVKLDRFLVIDIAAVKDKNDPQVLSASHVFLEENESWAFYNASPDPCMGGVECAPEQASAYVEIKEVIESFEML